VALGIGEGPVAPVAVRELPEAVGEAAAVVPDAVAGIVMRGACAEPVTSGAGTLEPLLEAVAVAEDEDVAEDEGEPEADDDPLDPVLEIALPVGVWPWGARVAVGEFVAGAEPVKGIEGLEADPVDEYVPVAEECEPVKDMIGPKVAPLDEYVPVAEEREPVKVAGPAADPVAEVKGMNVPDDAPVDEYVPVAEREPVKVLKGPDADPVDEYVPVTEAETETVETVEGMSGPTTIPVDEPVLVAV